VERDGAGRQAAEEEDCKSSIPGCRRFATIDGFAGAPNPPRGNPPRAVARTSLWFLEHWL
jgi:hypothetical protein